MRREGIDFEHRNWVRSNWFVPELIDAQFREFPPDTLMQRLGVQCLGFAVLHIVDVKVEPIV